MGGGKPADMAGAHPCRTNKVVAAMSSGIRCWDHLSRHGRNLRGRTLGRAHRKGDSPEAGCDGLHLKSLPLPGALDTTLLVSVEPLKPVSVDSIGVNGHFRPVADLFATGGKRGRLRDHSHWMASPRR